MDSLGTFQVLALIHGQATCSTAETIAFRSKFAGVANFAEELTIVFGAVRGVKQLLAKTCNTDFVMTTNPKLNLRKFY